MSSAKKQLLLHANCQGEPLVELLRLSGDFARLWDVRHYTNYTRELVPDAVLEECDFFAYQYLDAKWDEFASEAMLSRVNPKAETLCLPNMFFKGCWPLWTSGGPIAFGDILLNRLIDSGARKPEIISIYLHGDISKYVNMDENLDETFSYELEKEERCDIKTVPLVREHWREEMLFYTVNHPAKRLLVHVADGMLAALGLPPLSAVEIGGYQPEYAEFELPIHPQVADYFDMTYGGKGHEFRVFSRRLTFERYISRYIECHLQGMDAEFMGFLQLV